MTPFPLVALSPGDRVALVAPGSTDYVVLVTALLSAGVIPVPLDPKLTPAERDRLLRYVDPALVIATSQEVTDLAGRLPTATVPLARPMHLTSGTTGSPRASAAACSTRRRRRRCSPRSATCGVSRRTTSTSCSARSTTRLPSASRWARCSRAAASSSPGPSTPGAVTAAIERERPTTMFCVPTHLQRLLRPLGRAIGRTRTSPASGSSPTPGRACPPALKHRAHRAVPAGHRPGSSTARPRASSPPAAARSGSSARARSAGPDPGALLSVDPDGTIWCVVPEHARFTYLATRRRPRRPGGGDCVHRRRPRPDRRRRLPLPRRPPRGPGHHRRRQRLPGRGRARAREYPGVRDIAVLGVPDDELGAAGLRGRGGRGGLRGARRVGPRAAGTGRSGRRPTSAGRAPATR